MSVGERIKRRRKQLKMSAEDLGKKIGKNRATVYRYESSEIENLSIELIPLLARALNVSPAYLMGWEQIEPCQMSTDYPYFPEVKVSAGSPICVDCVEESEMITIPDELLGKYAGSKDIFFMRVNGESMNKIIPHDSLIAVKDVNIEEIKNGDIVVFSNGYDYSVKLFFDVGDKIIFRPNSNDPTFTDYIIDKNNEELRLHGKVITYIVNLD